MDYTSIIKKLAKNLTTVYKNTIFKNPTNIGDTREKEFINFLTKVMPRKYGFNSGEVFDKNNNNSGQIDVIIYDNLFSTVFSDGTDKILAPVESTYGIISIKSKMGVKELDHAIKGIKKYDNLYRPEQEDNAYYILPDLKVKGELGINIQKSYQQNINCIFALESNISKETLIKRIEKAECIDLLVIPGEFFLMGRLRNNDVSLSKDNKRLSYYHAISPEFSIPAFIVFLQLYLSNNKLICRDLRNELLWMINQK